MSLSVFLHLFSSLFPSLPFPLFPCPSGFIWQIILAAFKSHLLVFHDNNFLALSFRDFNPQTDDLFLCAGDSTLWPKRKTQRAKPLTQQPKRKSEEGAKSPTIPFEDTQGDLKVSCYTLPLKRFHCLPTVPSWRPSPKLGPLGAYFISAPKLCFQCKRKASGRTKNQLVLHSHI